MAKGRLGRLESLSKEQFEKYDAAVKQLVSDVHAELAPDLRGDKVVSYLPHRPVFKESSTTTSTRVVVDPLSSHKGEGLSLNQFLEVRSSDTLQSWPRSCHRRY